MSINSFRELKAWQLGMDLAERIYVLTDSLPKSETYGLTSQMRRSAVSIPSNLAEGHGRDSTKEFLHFIAIAIGSICELETQILLSHRLNYLKTSDLDTIVALLTETRKTIRGLQKALKAKLGVRGEGKTNIYAESTQLLVDTLAPVGERSRWRSLAGGYTTRPSPL